MHETTETAPLTNDEREMLETAVDAPADVQTPIEPDHFAVPMVNTLNDSEVHHLRTMNARLEELRALPGRPDDRLPTRQELDPQSRAAMVVMIGFEKAIVSHKEFVNREIERIQIERGIAQLETEQTVRRMRLLAVNVYGTVLDRIHQMKAKLRHEADRALHTRKAELEKERMILMAGTGMGKKPAEDGIELLRDILKHADRMLAESVTSEDRAKIESKVKWATLKLDKVEPLLAQLDIELWAVEEAMLSV